MAIAPDTPSIRESASQEALTASQLVSHLLAGIPASEPLDARALLAAHPELRECASAVLDIAYEEYCRRREAGEQVDGAAFAQGFPEVRSSLVRLLEVHEQVSLDPSQAWPDVGQQFQGFELVERLGKGAFSRVFLARQPELGGRTVVVKISRLGAVEPYAMGRLNHPHIVPVFSVHHDSATRLLAICMPFLGRATLHDLLHAPDRVPADIRGEPHKHWLLQIGAQLADALAHAHQRGIFHCDIKPSNVLLTAKGAMLLDFNLARLEGTSGGVGGTLPYMAPELLQSLASDSALPAVDGKQDVFSLGMLLYELFAGKLPWPVPSQGAAGRAAAARMLRLRAAPIPPLNEEMHNVSAAVAHLVGACLRADPASRPSAGQLAAGLQQALQGWPSPLHRHARRKVLSAAALVACGAALGGWAYWTHKPSTDKLFAEALGAYAAGQPTVARQRLDLILAQHPEHRPARFLRGRCWMDLHELHRARDDFSSLFGLAQQHPIAAAVYGWALAQNPLATQADFSQASRCGGIAIRAFSRPSPAAGALSKFAVYINLGYAQFMARDYARALKSLHEAELVRPDEALVHFHLARTHFNCAGDKILSEEQLHYLRLAAASGARAARLAPDVAEVQILAMYLHYTLHLRGALSAQERSAAIAQVVRFAIQARRRGAALESIFSRVASPEFETALVASGIADIKPEIQTAIELPRVLEPIADIRLAIASL